MQAILYTIPTLAVAGIYCVLQSYYLWRHSREQRLRQRVAYMLWKASTQVR